MFLVCAVHSPVCVEVSAIVEWEVTFSGLFLVGYTLLLNLYFPFLVVFVFLYLRLFCLVRPSFQRIFRKLFSFFYKGEYLIFLSRYPFIISFLFGCLYRTFGFYTIVFKFFFFGSFRPNFQSLLL